MATIKINLNNETVPFTCFAAGADVSPNLKLNYDAWPETVIAENIDNVEQFQIKMDAIFDEVLQRDTLITFEIV